MREVMSDSASVVTYKQACLCLRGTATRGRRVVYQYGTLGGGLRIETVLHSEPVCDTCDTPWRRIEAA
jgi:hypothetical protein